MTSFVKRLPNLLPIITSLPNLEDVKNLLQLDIVQQVIAHPNTNDDWIMAALEDRNTDLEADIGTNDASFKVVLFAESIDQYYADIDASKAPYKVIAARLSHSEKLLPSMLKHDMKIKMRVARTWLFKSIADEHIIGRPIAVFLIFVELIFLVLLLVLNVTMMESVQHNGPLTAFEYLGLIVFFGLNCYFTARECYQGLTMQRLGLWLAYCR